MIDLLEDIDLGQEIKAKAGVDLTTDEQAYVVDFLVNDFRVSRPVIVQERREAGEPHHDGVVSIGQHATVASIAHEFAHHFVNEHTWSSPYWQEDCALTFSECRRVAQSKNAHNRFFKIALARVLDRLRLVGFTPEAAA